MLMTNLRAAYPDIVNNGDKKPFMEKDFMYSPSWQWKWKSSELNAAAEDCAKFTTFPFLSPAQRVRKAHGQAAAGCQEISHQLLADSLESLDIIVAADGGFNRGKLLHLIATVVLLGVITGRIVKLHQTEAFLVTPFEADRGQCFDGFLGSRGVDIRLQIGILEVKKQQALDKKGVEKIAKSELSPQTKPQNSTAKHGNLLYFAQFAAINYIMELMAAKAAKHGNLPCFAAKVENMPCDMGSLPMAA
nr:hypothetical protein Iba_chr03cCG5550 [Ipomoea batatas]